MIIFGKKDYNAELDNIKKAIEVLENNFEKKIINRDYYIKKMTEFNEKKEKIERKLNK